jgi:peptidoglycan/xylan/chitin deacetylase (PgdA/CDA1 family)
MAPELVSRHHGLGSYLMDDGFTAFRTRGRRAAAGRVPTVILRRSNAPHHRRRRGLAIAALVVAVVGFALLVGGGGHTSPARHRPITTPRGLFSRIRLLAGAGAGSLAAEEQVDEAAAINRTLATIPYVRIAGDQHREIALTFDDGPGPYTPRVLQVLEQDHAPGTFFEVGIEDRYFHASTARIVRDGFPIGDHTQTHAAMGRLSRRDQLSQLLEQTASIGNSGAPFPRLFRPPYGLWNDQTLALLGRYRMLMVLWTVDTGDYRRPGTRAIVTSALAGARPGAIILLHDAGGDRSQTVAALPAIIRGLRQRGYKLVTVPRLLLDNPPPRNQNFGPLAGSGG